MIQFNLLPDVKLQLVKANRLKHTVSVVAIIAAGVALFIAVLLIITVDVVQKSHMNSLNTQITTLSGELKDTPNLDQVLTVQDEVNALPGLNSQLPVATRLSGFVSELTPSTATISTLNVNFQTNVITIAGSAGNLATINQFVDTLKLSSYQASSSLPTKNAFSDVVLSSFGYTSSTGASYAITANVDPTIFSDAYGTVALNVPNSTSTHSASTSSTLFQPQTSSSTSTTNSSGN
jgi:hypothetical protein